ncbi:diphthine--ammonia ligase [uncultured Brachyspira sp.]|uniref:Dph6-related ATP pyrophosphatase n=1 Tax=uncultured Brachyspira sp. TaxID=221953 RepID=UPI00262C4B34|nr:diphthine--ammonia ligase [uncultured Brachyspira sp.]
MSKKFVMSYSGGKDSTLALYKMIKDGYIPQYIMTTINEEDKHSWFHGISKELFDEVSKCLDIPHIAINTTHYTYRVNFIEELKKVKEEGINICAFGDIDIQMHRDWAENLCKESGFESKFPLWHQSRISLAREFVNAGFKAKIKIIDTSKLDKKYLGIDFTNELIDEFISIGIDPAGESGEFHTFVYDGPIFKKPLDIKLSEIHDFENHSSINIYINISTI